MMRSWLNQAEATLVEECEAYLDGRFAELAASAGELVPVWAWMNLLAHGTEAELRAAADELATSGGWQQARAFLAGEILDLVDAGRVELPGLQRDVLVPLELDIVACQTTGGWTPGPLVRGLLGVLPSRYERVRR